MPNPKPVTLTVMVSYDNGRIAQSSVMLSAGNTATVSIDKNTYAEARIVTKADDDRREYDRTEPVALDQRDAGNTEPEQLTEPLDPDDDVYTLVNKDTDPQQKTTQDNE